MKWKLPLSLSLLAGVALTWYLLKHELPAPTVVVFGEDSSNLKAYSSLKDDFATETSIQLTFEGVPFEQSIQKADADFRNGTGDYDIVLQYNFSLAPYVSHGYIAALDDVFSESTLKTLRANDNIFENVLRETCFYYSNPQDTKSVPQQFGFPFAANTMLLVYNQDLFDNAELKARYKSESGKSLVPPTEWLDYIAVAEFFVNATPDIKGVCMQGASDGWLYYELCNYLFGMGTGTSNKRYGWEEGAPITIASAQNAEVLQYCKRLRATSSGDFFTVGASQQQGIMLRGKTAMALMWSDYIQPLAVSQTPRFGFAPIPGKISGLAGGAFYINRRSRHMEAASKFVLYALAPEHQKQLMGKGLCSPLKTAYTKDVLSRVPYARALRDSLTRGVFMFEAGSDAEIINSALTTSMQRFIRGEISETDALALAEKEVLAKRAAGH